MFACQVIRLTTLVWCRYTALVSTDGGGVLGRSVVADVSVEEGPYFAVVCSVFIFVNVFFIKLDL